MCAPQVRHCIMHTRRAGHLVTRPLNCGVMRYRPLIISFACVVVVVLAAVAGFILWLLLDMRAVERVARDCQPLVEALAKVKSDAGLYPSSSSELLPMHLTQLCHYQNHGDTYVL